MTVPDGNAGMPRNFDTSERLKRMQAAKLRVVDNSTAIRPARAAPRGPRRQRILVLAPRDPHPAIGGDRVRIYGVARELANRYDLTLLTFCRNDRERAIPLPADSVFKQVHRIVLPRWRRCVSTLAALPTRLPLQVAYYRSREFQDAVRSLAPAHDAVIAHLVRTADYAQDLPVVRVLEMTDAISMNMQRVAATRTGYLDLRRLVYAIEAKRLSAYERRAAKNFDVLTLTSGVDAAFLFPHVATLPHHVMIMANGVDVPTWRAPIAARRPGEIAMVANFASLPNFDAAWYFSRSVLPLVRQRVPGARLRLIGPMPPVAKRRLAGVPGVEVVGIVPNVAHALASARLGICPVRFGSGIQNKVLDYFASRLPVVCSPLGLEGLEARPDEHLLTAATTAAWANSVHRLLSDDVLAQRLADAGRRLVEQRYHWNQRIGPLIERLDECFHAREACAHSERRAEWAEAAV